MTIMAFKISDMPMIIECLDRLVPNLCAMGRNDDI